MNIPTNQNIFITFCILKWYIFLTKQKSKILKNSLIKNIKFDNFGIGCGQYGCYRLRARVASSKTLAISSSDSEIEDFQVISKINFLNFTETFYFDKSMFFIFT